jgi:hypothetical protein
MSVEFVEVIIEAGTVFATTAVIGLIVSTLAKWFSKKKDKAHDDIKNFKPWYYLSKEEWWFVSINIFVGVYHQLPNIFLGLIIGFLAAVMWYLILTIPQIFEKK